MTGTYTCIATHTTFSDATVNDSVHITVLCEYVEIMCPLSYYIFYLVNCEVAQSTELIIVNMTSTAMGSIATYQCRDGPTDDVYTTQCTSTGVWDPHPLSHLNCTTRPSAADLTTNTEPTSSTEPTTTKPGWNRPLPSCMYIPPFMHTHEFLTCGKTSHIFVWCGQCHIMCT